MNKKFLKSFILIILFLSLTGCTKILKDKDNKAVKYNSDLVCSSCESTCSSNKKKYEELKDKTELTEEQSNKLKDLEKIVSTCSSDCKTKCELAKKNQTGQTLTSNILCQPTNEDVKLIYELNDVNIKNLPSCKNFAVNSGKYEGLWTSLLVKPLAWLILKLGTFIGNYGLSLIIISLLIRLLMMPLTKNTAMQSENIKKAKPELDAIEKKYKEKYDQESVMKKSQETMTIYKKYGVNPLSSCLFALLQIPLLFSFIEAINRTPAIFEENLLGFKLGVTPLIAFSNSEWWYIIIVILLGLVTLFSFNLNKTASASLDSQKQMNIMNKVFIVMIIFMSLSMSTAISIYWITSSSFTVIQNIVVKRSKK